MLGASQGRSKGAAAGKSGRGLSGNLRDSRGGGTCDGGDGGVDSAMGQKMLYDTSISYSEARSMRKAYRCYVGKSRLSQMRESSFFPRN